MKDNFDLHPVHIVQGLGLSLRNLWFSFDWLVRLQLQEDPMRCGCLGASAPGRSQAATLVLICM